MRLKLRDRLHRARLDRRKQNENPLAKGTDPDAPDWFAPDTGAGNDVGDAGSVATPAARERSKEAEIVNSGDPSRDDDPRGGATTADVDEDAGIIEASREPEDGADPEFGGEIPGFSDWREELRERLKRIRERRERERLASEADAAETGATTEQTEAAAQSPTGEQGIAEAPAHEGLTEAAGPLPVQGASEEAAEQLAARDPIEVAAEQPPAAGANEVGADAPPATNAPAEGSEETPAADATEDGAEEPATTTATEEGAEIDRPVETVAGEVADAPTPEQVEETPRDDAGPLAAVTATAGDLIARIVDGASGRRAASRSKVDNESADVTSGPEQTTSRADDDIPLVVAEPDAIELDFDADIGAEPEADESAAPELDIELPASSTEPPADLIPADRSAGAGTVEEVLEAADAAKATVDVPASEAAEAEADETETAIEVDQAESVVEEEGREDTVDPGTDATSDTEAVVAEPRPSFSWGAAPAEIDTDKALQSTPPAVAAAQAYEARRSEELAALRDNDPARQDRASELEAAPIELGDTVEAAGPAEEAELGSFAEPSVDAGPAELTEPEEDTELVAAAEPAEDTEPLKTVDADKELPKLDFDEAAIAAGAAPALDLALDEEEAEDEKQSLQWDAEDTISEPTVASSAGPLAERAAAALCDLLVLTAIAAALVGAASSGTGLPFRQVMVEQVLPLGLTWAIFAVGYSVFLVGSCGQTIGRMVMRLRVVGEDQFSVGFDRAAMRLGAWVISALPLLAGMIPALKDPQRRGLHDRLSRTRVVKA